MQRQALLSAFFSKPRAGDGETISESALISKAGTACTSSQDPELESGKSSKRKAESLKTAKRKFNKTWESLYEWIDFDASLNKASCKYCKQLPDSGVDRKWISGIVEPFKKETFSSHDKSKVHISNTETVKGKDLPTSETPIAKCIKRMDDKMFSHMTNLFNIAYYIAKNEKSFADFRDLLSLASKLNVEILKQYGNEIECRQFIHFIGKTIINDIVDKMKTSMFIGILIDGSTDRTSDEHAIVYARYIDNGIIKEDFLGVVDLDSACAASYFSALTDLLNKHFKKESYENKVYIAGLGTDGAASMIGCHNGLTEKMKEVCPQLITVHCVAHRLQLAVLDVCHSVEYLQTFDKILRTTFKFYNGSAKRLHNLKEAAIVLGEDIRKLGDVSNVRWLASRANALKALVYSWKAIVTQLEQSVVNKDSDSAKAKGMLQSLKTFKFVQVLHFLLDVFSKMKALSLCFQDKELMISSLKEKIKYTIKALEDLKEQKGDYEITFANDVSSTGVYKDVQLLNVQLGENSFKALRQNVIESAKNYLDERLTSVSTDIVSSFHIFDSATWPTKDKILQFGNEEIKMLALHISDQKCNEEKINFLTAEWCEYKFLFSNVTFTEALLKMQAHKARFPNLYELISFCAVIPVTTASCERGFSCYNRIKTAYRNALKTATMNDLLVCSVTGPSLNEFDPNKAIDLWYFSAKRQRYV